MERSAGMNGEERWSMENEEAQKGVTIFFLKLNLQNDRVAGLLESQNGRACNFQNDRACSLRELSWSCKCQYYIGKKKCRITI